MSLVALEAKTMSNLSCRQKQIVLDNLDAKQRQAAELCSNERLQTSLSNNANVYKRVKRNSVYYVRVITASGRIFHCMRHTTEKFFNQAVEVLKELEREEGLRVFNVKNLKTLNELNYFDE